MDPEELNTLCIDKEQLRTRVCVMEEETAELVVEVHRLSGKLSQLGEVKIETLDREIAELRRILHLVSPSFARGYEGIEQVPGGRVSWHAAGVRARAEGWAPFDRLRPAPYVPSAMNGKAGT